MKTCRTVLFLLAFLLAPSLAAAAELVMVEQAGCHWCEAWDEEVGGVYARTPEGKAAPLRRVDIHEPLPRDLHFIKGLAFTPTFVLVNGGREVGRINGYPGQAFFWGQLDRLLQDLPSANDALTRTHLERPARDSTTPATRG